MRNLLREFRQFIATGSMIELAVAVILGAAVSGVIDAFTNGIVLQVVAAVVGEPDFSDITITLREAVGTDDDGNRIDSVLRIGDFLDELVTLALTGLVLFFLVKGYNRMKRRAESEPVTDPGPSEIDLLTEIRDALRQRST